MREDARAIKAERDRLRKAIEAALDLYVDVDEPHESLARKMMTIISDGIRNTNISERVRVH